MGKYTDPVVVYGFTVKSGDEEKYVALIDSYKEADEEYEFSYFPFGLNHGIACEGFVFGMIADLSSDGVASISPSDRETVYKMYTGCPYELDKGPKFMLAIAGEFD